MSLKTFHILFIILSICMCFCFGIWTVNDFAKAHNATRLGLGIASFGVGGLLIYYLSRVFMRD